MTFEEILASLPDRTRVLASVTFATGHVGNLRIARDGDSIFVYAHRSKRYGTRYTSFSGALQSIQVKEPTKKSEAEIWFASWYRVERMLVASGLWPEILATTREGLAIGYEAIKEASEAYWSDTGVEQASWDEKEAARIERIRAINPRFIKISSEDKPYINTDLVWRMSHPAKIKKMYFGKYRNDETLAKIAQAMRDRTPLQLSGDNGYDVSFSYQPEKQVAFYSEEYRGCGNGHYYIAISATHALFMEDY